MTHGLSSGLTYFRSGQGGADGPSRSDLRIAVGIALAGVLLRLLLLSRPGHLLGVVEYDDGVYFGAALRLVEGELPYKDFVLVQPPGIALLMAPVALLAKIIGTAGALGAGRIVTVFVDGANIALCGLLASRWGRMSLIVASSVMALYPDAIASSQTVLLEPYMNLFILLALSTLFLRDRALVAGKRFVASGVFLGIAGATKTWAVVPAIVLLTLAGAERWNGSRSLSRMVGLAAGMAVGFLGVCGLFIAIAPRRFFAEVVVDQLSRAPGGRVTLWARLRELMGAGPLVWFSPASFGTAVVSILTVAVIVLVILASVKTLRSREIFDRLSVVSFMLVLAALLWPSDFYYHYADFLAPFLALVAGLAFSVSEKSGTATWFPRRWSRVSFWAALAAALMYLGVEVYFELGVAPAPTPPAAVEALVPAGACVASDQVSLLIAADRFPSKRSGCPFTLDPYGAALALSGGLTIDGGAARTSVVVSSWISEMRIARFIWLSPGNQKRLPWSASARAYFAQNFAQELQMGPRLGTLYSRRSAEATQAG